METDIPVQSNDVPASTVAEESSHSVIAADGDSTSKVADMEVDAEDAAGQNKTNESERKEELTSLQADDDDAVEYQLLCQGLPSSFDHRVLKLTEMFLLQNVIVIFACVFFSNVL